MTQVQTTTPIGGILPQTVAFGVAAAVTIVFNTVLAWVKDAYEPLNTLMAHTLGHHWITHGVLDVALFLILGYVLSNATVARTLGGDALAKLLIVATVVGGGGLAGWFLFV